LDGSHGVRGKTRVKIKAEIRGEAKLAEAFSNLDDSAQKMFVVGLKTWAIRVHEEAVRGMQKISMGREYKRGSHTHIASRPGDPPNIDTGRLVSSVKFKVDDRALSAAVGSDVDYSVGLEFGTARVEPRPWLRPAIEKVRHEIKTFFKLEVKK
jgi:hypothetical protein